MKLTSRNYYSRKANKLYLSVSQYKDFCGTMGKQGCEYTALAKLKGIYNPEPTKAMLMGSYVDAAYEGTLKRFIKNTPQMFNKNGTLKAEFIKAQQAYDRTQQDDLFKLYMLGQKQVIMTANIFDVDWKIKIDSYFPDKCIVDLKYIKDIHERCYVKDFGHVNFIEYWGYDLQLAIYQLVVEANTGKKLPCYIAAVDKKETPNIEIIKIEQEQLDASLLGIQSNIQRIQELKTGKVIPDKCHECDYCIQTKVLTSPISSTSLIY
ncbi:MAG: PD-(D/E)XK nuclease-like domain-containing protein [Muribaculaceae bacterium]|nr:PD-(D/E)XK nuclease-like domain-containing protein [Muribaculaceae bacterium]